MYLLTIQNTQCLSLIQVSHVQARLSWCVQMLFLFQGCSHLQYLIDCCMQIWRGKAREIWSRVITSGRQLFGGRFQQRISKPILVMSVTGLEDKSIQKAASIQFDVRNVRGLFHVKQELTWSATAPCVYNNCLPNDITRDQISQVFPLCICIYSASHPILEVGGGFCWVWFSG